MEPVLARYIWRHTRPQQLWILSVVALSMIPYFLSFDLPKQIISGPLQGKGFPDPTSTATMFRIAFDLPLVGHVVLFDGVALDRMQALLGLSIVFLLLVVVNGAFKFYINTYKGRLGERMLRRIRFELVDRVLRHGPSYFKRVKPAEVATMVKDEVEPLGGFIGDAFVLPLLLAGQALTALIFIVVQNHWLGIVATSVVTLQVLIIPKMRKRLLRLGRERQLTARELSGRVAEIVESINAIQTNDTSNWERAEIGARLARIFHIRYDLYQWKFLVKFLNNFLAQLTPFLFYLIGGYLVVKGRLDVGQLVAVIAAYKDLPGPLKDLIDWDQNRQDVQVKYAQVVEQFDVRDILPPESQALTTEPRPLGRPLAVENLTLIDETGARLLDSTSLAFRPGQTVAVVGTPGSGGEALVDALARVIWPTTGRVVAGSEDLQRLPQSVTGRRIAYAGPEAHLFAGSILENLVYGLKHAPVAEPIYDAAEARRRKWEMAEAMKAGNPVLDVRADWIDYRLAGVEDAGRLFDALEPLLETVGMAGDVFEIGLRTSIDPEHHLDIPPRVVAARAKLRRRMEELGMAELVIPFQEGAYNPEATVAENLLFGTATGPELETSTLAANPYLRGILETSGLDRRLYDLGFEVAENAVELFRDVAIDHSMLQQLSIAGEQDLQALRAIVQRRDGRDMDRADEADRRQLLQLAFAYIEPRLRFGLLDDDLMARIVEAREIFHADLPTPLANGLERYDSERFNRSATLLDNALFGRVGHHYSDASRRVTALVLEIFRELGLYRMVVGVGLRFGIGPGGRRVTLGLRQKINLARALLKRPDYLLLNRPLAALDGRVQEQILANVLAYRRSTGADGGVVWALSMPSLAKHFDRVIVFDGASLAEDGEYDDLVQTEGVLKRLVS
ncbi:ABC transporter transmembrane domain-containing protein [Prosthecomicrobium sp. N25]|uniref:ABC transporter transmembrane domain-containing protein n=1 Tax=Prosthecomicrobium sp. N25 TaxID=3129254 RepID=UPI003077CAB8